MTRSNSRLSEVEFVSTPESKVKFIYRLRELYHYRFLLINLVRRDLKVRYKGSALGVLWTILNPLFMMLVFTVIFQVAFGRGDIRQYSVFFLVGLIPWQFFSGAVVTGTNSITSSASILRKVYFPREMLPISAVLSHLVNFGYAFIVLVVFLYFSGLGITVHAGWLPLLLITQILFSMGLVLFLSALNVYYRDVLMIMDVLMLAWFFLTPIMYPLDLFGSSQTILGITFDPAQVMRWINPMASIIDGYRTVLWGTMSSTGPASMFFPYLYRTFITSLLVFVFGYWFFLKTEGTFGENL
ncbi:MAG: ABC transporter permease [Ardenticatenaceae bacterium]|nr:ABC transporter permease [Ardenticatenaceae bacterium]